MDLLLDYGDLSIDKVEYDNQDTLYYDLTLETEDQFISKLIKRTLETPLKYIKQTIVKNNKLFSLDSNYGNPLYKKLSEPLNMSFIVEAQQDITNSLTVLKDVPGLLIKSVNITNYSINSIYIEVNYSYKNQNVSSQFNLNT